MYKRQANSDESTVEHEFPNVTEHDAADQVRNEESCPEEVLALDAAGHKEGQDEGHHVHQDHRNGGVDHRPAQRLPVGHIRKGGHIIGDSHKGLLGGHAVPAGEGQIEAIYEGDNDDSDEYKGRHPCKHHELFAFVGHGISFHSLNPSWNAFLLMKCFSSIGIHLLLNTLAAPSPLRHFIRCICSSGLIFKNTRQS